MIYNTSRIFVKGIYVKMNILYCGDKNIEKGLIISIFSILKHINEELNIYVLTINFDKEKKENRS